MKPNLNSLSLNAVAKDQSLSLSVFFMRFWKKVISSQLIFFMNGVVNIFQSGCRALCVVLSQHSSKLLMTYCRLLMVLLDLSAAYDGVNHSIL